MRVGAVLLAAGKSQRMGTPKPLLAFQGETLATRLVRTLREGGADEVILVTGPGTVLSVPGAKTVLNPEPERGMLSSVQVGLVELPGSAALLVCPCDLPLLLPEHVAAVVTNWDGDAEALIRPMRLGKGGHPALFGPGLRDEILSLDPTRYGLNVLQKKYRCTDIQVEDDGPFLDADTPADWAKITHGRL
ncbi:MAG: nucleotidyltransferase family protein [Armatimonas sp.]